MTAGISFLGFRRRLVESLQKGQRGGFQRVGADGFPGEAFSLAHDLHQHFRLGFHSLRDAAHQEAVELRLDARDPLDGLADGVDRAVADRGVAGDLRRLRCANSTVAVGMVPLPAETWNRTSCQ